MKRLVYSIEDIFAMSNVLGRFIKVENNVPFSFYYSPRNSSHGPRVKPILNPSKMWLSKAGTLKLCDDWEFTPGQDDKHISSKVVNEMKAFFRKYLVLFLLVWDLQLPDPLLSYYFQGQIPLSEIIESLDFYDEFKNELDKMSTVFELEEFCRNNDLVNFYGN